MEIDLDHIELILVRKNNYSSILKCNIKNSESFFYFNHNKELGLIFRGGMFLNKELIPYMNFLKKEYDKFIKSDSREIEDFFKYLIENSLDTKLNKILNK